MNGDSLPSPASAGDWTSTLLPGHESSTGEPAWQRHSLGTRLFLSLLLLLLISPAVALAETLRIVTYNIQADTGGANGAIGGPTAGPGLTTVLQAIGSESLNGNAQPIDVLALQELYKTPTTTLQFIVGELNPIYGAGTYAYDTTNDPTDGNQLTGNGPSGLIYNTHTVVDLGAVAIGGTPSGSVQPRDPMRYTLEPVHAGRRPNSTCTSVTPRAGRRARMPIVETSKPRQSARFGHAGAQCPHHLFGRLQHHGQQRGRLPHDDRRGSGAGDRHGQSGQQLDFDERI